jgi:hypothetical protein
MFLSRHGRRVGQGEKAEDGGANGEVDLLRFHVRIVRARTVGRGGGAATPLLGNRRSWACVLPPTIA